MSHGVDDKIPKFMYFGPVYPANYTQLKTFWGHIRIFFS